MPGIMPQMHQMLAMPHEELCVDLGCTKVD